MINVMFLGMEGAFYGLLEGLAAGLLGGLLGGLGLRWGISRRCTRIEWALGDLQQRVSSMHGKKASAARWEQTEAFEKEIAEMMPKGKPARKRYDNDPLGEE